MRGLKYSLQISGEKVTTDKVAYTPGESVKVTGSVIDTSSGPLVNGTILASIVPRSSDYSYNNNTTTTEPNGEYVVYLTAPSTVGDYRIKINASSDTESVSAYLSLKVAAATEYRIDLDKAEYAPGGNVTAKVTVKDSSGAVVPDFPVNATLLYPNGTIYSQLGTLNTSSNGRAQFSFTAPQTIGNYFFMANSLVGQTVRVIQFTLSTYITDTDDNYQWMFAPSENATIHAKVNDPNGNAYPATISSLITSPSGATTTISNFTTLATGKYKAIHQIGVEEGSYSVKTTASSGNNSVNSYTSFYVSNLYLGIERIDSTNLPNSSYTVIATVKDSAGNLKNGSVVTATITDPLGTIVSSYNASEDR